MKIIFGAPIAQKITKKISERIRLKKLSPFLAVVLIGENDASKIYIKLKKEAAKKVGMGFKLLKFNKDVSEKLIIEGIEKLNNDKKINGIIVQLPLPKKFNTQKIIDTIDPKKDVDGFSAQGGNNIFDPVFPMAIIKLLESSKQKLENKKAIVIANSKLFGEIMIEALRRKKIKGEYILKSALSPALSQREREADVLEKIKEADILITAVGEKGIIKGGMLREGAIVIDGGIVKNNKKIFGDVDFDSVKKIAGFVTPVPGGVGPVTVACLLSNVLTAFENQN